MDNEQDILEIVDEIVDEANPPRIEREAERLGITPTELADRVGKELKTRVRDD